MKKSTTTTTETIVMSGARWHHGFMAGDLVRVTPYPHEPSEKHLGIVVEKVNVNQELMFPMVPVLVFSENKILEYQLNSVEIISKI